MMDQMIMHADVALRTLFAPAQSVRPYPDAEVEEGALNEQEKKHALGLMRVNHVGEVCAQALYEGQAITARSEHNKTALRTAAQEEVEHLAWTARRVHQLGGQTSLLNPLWYASSFAIGVGAGLLGDKWNLGFLEETENQVTAHLQQHLTQLPLQDAKSRAIVMQMKEDEMHHAHMAHDCGAAKLPQPVKVFMALSSKVMTSISYHI
ncbi:2-polyprenyl-3-methyl-6-methoxy-1,4-benzoquinone monooxygenase [Neisseriaceae bacterium ESL0693]|nr:2-polyprenyl-3-methyl-6-methoxy-1,4-benzoquinone monooxygenase [Neisseriaceae bacterium ESL0693]